MKYKVTHHPQNPRNRSRKYFGSKREAMAYARSQIGCEYAEGQMPGMVHVERQAENGWEWEVIASAHCNETRLTKA